MAKVTRGGVCYDLTNSPYNFSIDYKPQMIRYYFSSELNKKRFIERLQENRDNVNLSLSNRFGIWINFNKLADLALYKKVEKRGFYIVTSNGVIEWIEEITLDGETVIRKS